MTGKQSTKDLRTLLDFLWLARGIVLLADAHGWTSNMAQQSSDATVQQLQIRGSINTETMRCILASVGERRKEFARLVRQAERQWQAKDYAAVALTCFLVGALMGTEADKQFKLGWQRHQAQGRAGGKKNAPSAADMRRALSRWDKQIKASGMGKKKHAMGKLGIPIATYYRYQKAVK